MGKLIDVDKLKDIIEYCILANVPADAENTTEEKWNDWFQTVIDRVQPVEAIPKADYENRLKADLKAILVELQMEIEENGIVDFEETYVDDGECIISVSECNRLIQQKINELKGKSEEI